MRAIQFAEKLSPGQIADADNLIDLYDHAKALEGFNVATTRTRPMPELSGPAFSYRQDPRVPAFDDNRALFVFDGVCVLCSVSAAFLMRNDRHGQINFTPVRSELGQALYAHYAVDWNTTYLLVEAGRAYTASAGYLRLCKVLGGAWRLLRVTAVVPELWRDMAYTIVARNRYRWFGTVAHCALLKPEERARLI